MEQTTYTTHNAQETAAIGAKLAEAVEHGGVILLYGDLGSGKTTFTQGLAKRLGITKPVNSPTFLIVKKYELGIRNQESGRNFYHIDLYRLEDEKGMEGIGLKEILEDEENIVVIEWSEKLEKMVPRQRIELHLRYIQNDEREIIVLRYE